MEPEQTSSPGKAKPSPAAAGEPEGRWSEIFVGPYGIYTLVLNLGMAVFATNQFVVSTIMPTVTADLGGLDYYSWAFSLFAVGAIVGAAGAGPFSDAFGRRIVYAGSGLVLAIGLAGTALATDMPTLVGFRLVQGLGGGAVASMAFGLIAVIYPPNLRGRVLGVVSGIWGVGTVFGPAVGGFFAEPGLWRGAFWGLMAFAAVFVILAWRHVEGRGGHGQLSELPFWRLAMLSLAVLMMSATSLIDDNIARIALFAAALVVTVLAFRRDARSERTMFPQRVMTVGTEIGAGYWILFLVSIVITFFNTYTTYYLQVLHDVPPLTAGYLLALQSLMWTFSALAISGLPRSAEPYAIVAGLGCVLAASIAIAFLTDSGPVVAIAAAMMLSGVGLGLINIPTVQRVIQAAADNEQQIAGTSVQTIRNIGISFGAAASGMVAAMAGISDDASLDSVAFAMNWVYGVNVGFAVLALLAAIPLFLYRQD